jgi:hypothetical protein
VPFILALREPMIIAAQILLGRGLKAANNGDVCNGALTRWQAIETNEKQSLDYRMGYDPKLGRAGLPPKCPRTDEAWPLSLAREDPLRRCFHEDR